MTLGAIIQRNSASVAMDFSYFHRNRLDAFHVGLYAVRRLHAVDMLNVLIK
jgi:hypothetical protein